MIHLIRRFLRHIIQPFLDEVFTRMDENTQQLQNTLTAVSDKLTKIGTEVSQWIADHSGGATAEDIARLQQIADAALGKADAVDALIPDAETPGEPE